MKRMYAIEIDIDKWTSARWYLITMSMMKLLKYECVLFQMVFDEHIGHWVAIYEKLDFDENYGALCHKLEDCSFWIFLCSLGDRLKMEYWRFSFVQGQDMLKELRNDVKHHGGNNVLIVSSNYFECASSYTFTSMTPIGFCWEIILAQFAHGLSQYFF